MQKFLQTFALQNSGMLFAKGIAMTLALWIIGVAISLTAGILWGILRSNKLRIHYVSLAFDGITFVLRGVSYYVQLLITYFVLPNFIGIDLSAFAAAVLSLGLCSAAYVSQIIKGAIDALPEGQREACFVLGYSQVQALWYVVLPQVLRNSLLGLANEIDQLLKSTSIASSIGILELTRVGMNIIAREMNPAPVYFAIAMTYLTLSWILSFVVRNIARRISYVVR